MKRPALLSLESSAWLLRLAQISLLSLFISLGLIVSLTASEGPDEVAHFYFIRFVAEHGRLPLDVEERLEAGYKADLPPFYYLVAGWAGRAIDLESPPFLKITRNNTRLQLVTGHENLKAWRMIRTEDPLRGEVLLWAVGRWVALLGGLLSLLLTYRLLRRGLPASPWLALAGMALLAFLPVYVYVSGISSYESLTAVLMTAYSLLLLRTLQQPNQTRLYFGLGLLIGLAALTRQTVWPVLIAGPVLMTWLAYRHGWPWSLTFGRLALFGLAVLLTFGLWLLYVVLYFNQVAELGWLQGLINPILVGDGSGRTNLQIAGLLAGADGEVIGQAGRDSIWAWAWHFFTAIWGSGWVGWLLLGLWGLALAGLIWRWPRLEPSSRLWLLVLAGHVVLLLLFPLIRFVFSGETATAFGQHLAFPGGAMLVLLLLWGLSTWVESPARLAGGVFILVAIYVGQSITMLPTLAGERFPIQTVPLAQEPAPRASLAGMSLLAATSRVVGDHLLVTLQWRAEEKINEDYQIELTLLDATGQSQSGWLGQPLNGRYPTRAWQPGDRLRDELTLPLSGLPAGDYQLQLRLLSPVERPAGESLSLETLTLNPPPFQPDHSLSLAEQNLGYTVWLSSGGEPPTLGENATVLVVAPVLADLRLSLVDPAGQAHEPLSRFGSTYNFFIEPSFSSGIYHLRAELGPVETDLAQAESPLLFTIETEPRQFVLQPPPSQPVTANFAGYVNLLGYDLPERQVQPGQALPVTLYWQARRTIGADLIVFSVLVGEDGTAWPGRDRVAREVYSTMFWAPGEIVADPFTFQIDPAVPAGIYTLHVGLYLPVGEAPVQLPLVQEGEFSQITHVEVGPIMVELP